MGLTPDERAARAAEGEQLLADFEKLVEAVKHAGPLPVTQRCLDLAPRFTLFFLRTVGDALDP